jgi:hypothetical protein
MATTDQAIGFASECGVTVSVDAQGYKVVTALIMAAALL